MNIFFTGVIIIIIIIIIIIALFVCEFIRTGFILFFPSWKGPLLGKVVSNYVKYTQERYR